MRSGHGHDANARRNADVDRGCDHQQATLLTPRAIHRDGLHGAREYEAHAVDFIAEDAKELRWREWQMQVLWLVDLVDVIAPFVGT